MRWSLRIVKGDETIVASHIKGHRTMTYQLDARLCEAPFGDEAIQGRAANLRRIAAPPSSGSQ